MRKLKLGIFGAALFSAIFICSPLKAAEKIFLSYGPFLFSLKVESLAAFAEDGTVNQDLEFYLSRVTPEQQEIFRQALNKKNRDKSCVGFPLL